MLLGDTITALQQVLQNGSEGMLFLLVIVGILSIALIDTIRTQHRERNLGQAAFLAGLVLLVFVLAFVYGGRP